MAIRCPYLLILAVYFVANRRVLYKVKLAGDFSCVFDRIFRKAIAHFEAGTLRCSVVLIFR